MAVTLAGSSIMPMIRSNTSASKRCRRDRSFPRSAFGRRRGTPLPALRPHRAGQADVRARGHGRALHELRGRPRWPDLQGMRRQGKLRAARESDFEQMEDRGRFLRDVFGG